MNYLIALMVSLALAIFIGHSKSGVLAFAAMYLKLVLQK